MATLAVMATANFYAHLPPDFERAGMRRRHRLDSRAPSPIREACSFRLAQSELIVQIDGGETESRGARHRSVAS